MYKIVARPLETSQTKHFFADLLVDERIAAESLPLDADVLEVLDEYHLEFDGRLAKRPARGARDLPTVLNRPYALVAEYA